MVAVTLLGHGNLGILGGIMDSMVPPGQRSGKRLIGTSRLQGIDML